ncbi:MAG: hypothetical protein ACO218_00440 [Steroidobacteraceae bacterium]
MALQQHLALVPPEDSLGWSKADILEPRVLAAVMEANAEFLALLCARRATAGLDEGMGLAPKVLAGLPLRVGDTGPMRLPVALFDLRFRDHAYWRSQAQASASIRDHADSTRTDVACLRFTRSAVVLAWHLAHCHPAMARLTLGLEGRSLQVMRDVPVGALDSLASRVAPALRARFARREAFWHLLCLALKSGGHHERLRIAAMQLQGAEAARALPARQQAG